MKKSIVKIAVAAALSLVAAQANAVIINIQNASGRADQDIPIAVSLDTEGSQVAGTQNDISFTDPLRIKANTNNRPDCAVNPAIMKSGTSFAFQPPACTGTACTGIRALVLALDNVDPIADDAILYTCQLNIAAGAEDGNYELVNSGEGASDPAGNALTTTGTNGTVTVAGPPVASIDIGSVDGNAGDFVTFSVSLDVIGEGTQVAGTQNDITFDPLTPVSATQQGRPSCVVNAAIMKGGTSFAFQPPGCTVGTSCTAIRALVLALDNVDPIPDNSVLYSCQVAIDAEAAEDSYPLVCSGAGASDPAGNAITIGCNNGAVNVVVVPTPTATPTETVELGTPTITPTNTRSATPTRSVTVIPPTNDCDDGCSVVAPSNGQSGWLLLFPAAMLFWLRRRSR